MSEQRFKIVTADGVLAYDNKGEGLTEKAAEEDCDRRNRMALQLGLATKYEVAQFGSKS